MSILRGARLCAFASFILFSCNTKTKDKQSTERSNSTIVQTATFLPQQEAVNPVEEMNMQAFHTGFIDNKTQNFTVSAKSITNVQSRGGLKLSVDPAFIEREDGSPLQGNIEVSIVELTNVDDLFKSNAATISNGRLLASGGSYFIGMKNGKSKIRIKKGASLQAEFPVLKKEDMQLFYGQRDVDGNMNWTEANDKLQSQYETISFNTADKYRNFPAPDLSVNPANKGYFMYSPYSINNQVIFMGKQTTVKYMVNTILNRRPDRIIDTLYYSWNSNYGRKSINYYRDKKFIYGRNSGMIFRIIPAKESAAEKDSLDNLSCEYQQKKLEWEKKVDFKTQLKQTYAPAAVTELGWINCDRFYNSPQQAETELQMPYALNNTKVEYFVLFKSFNGLLNDKAVYTGSKNIVLQKLPVGESITLVAFTKKNGIVYQAKQDFVVSKNKKQQLNFKEISADELTKIFGANIKV